MDLFVWIGIVACLSQSAMFSGLNLAFFGLSRLELEVEAAVSPKARRVLAMRQDSNFLLTTILWGNVAINVLLTLLSGSVLTGVSAFFFSTVAITFFGEICPQAYFSRHALRMAALLAPVLRAYQVLLYPVAKPTALLLNAWLGRETPRFLQERMIRELLLRHVQDTETDLDAVEGIGALNFLEIDDLPAAEEGEPVDPRSLIPLPATEDGIRFPSFSADRNDSFIKRVNASGRKWVIVVDQDTGEPKLVMDADAFLRDALLRNDPVNPMDYCFPPIVVGPRTSLRNIIRQLVRRRSPEKHVIEQDAVLVWSDVPRIITGADLLDRLLEGIR